MHRPPSPPRVAWAHDLWTRMRCHFALKLIGTTVVTSVFFVAYLHLLRHPAYPVMVMPLTALDQVIPFEPTALIAYLSLWIYVGAGPGLQRDLRELIVYGLWITAMCVCGLAVFYFWPTEVPPFAIDVARFPASAMLHTVDASGNACPSMHVAAATFTVIRVADVLNRSAAPPLLRVANAVWFAAIVFSTLATKQHVVIDAAAGALLGIAFALPSLRWRPNPAARPHDESGHPVGYRATRAAIASTAATGIDPR